MAAINQILNVRYGQSVIDACMQSYGNLNLIYKLINDNNLSSINDDNLTNKNLTFDASLIKDFGVFESGFIFVSKESIEPKAKFFQDGNLFIFQTGEHYLFQ